VGADAAHHERPKCVRHHFSHGFRRESLTLMCRREREPELGLPVHPTRVKRHVSNQQARGCEAHGKLKPCAGCSRRQVMQRCDELFRFTHRVWALPILIAGHIGLAPVRGESVGIVRREATDDQAPGDQLFERAIFHPSTQFLHRFGSRRRDVR
jgi:hypothetical protein